MKKILENLNSSFKINQIIIENFTILDDDITIVIKINSQDKGYMVLTFEGVLRINICSEYYTCSEKSSIILEDLTSAQMEGIKYKISVSEDVMTFYCKSISLKEFG